MHQTDVLIIGCGITGCTTALELAKHGVKVTMVTGTREARDSASFWAGKGLAYRGREDSAELFAQDLQRFGGGLSYPKAIEQLVTQGPDCVDEILIKELQVEFERSPEGELCFHPGQGHSTARILHFRDHTGKPIIDGLLRRLSELPNVEIWTEHMAVDLITLHQHSEKSVDLYKSPTCLGAYLLDETSGEVKTVLAKETVLAAGGLGDIYLHSTNPSQVRGDGIAMAHRAGVRMAHIDRIQFFPTAFYNPNERLFLISQALRGEGATLLSTKGQPFMEKYHEAGSQAPDDFVAKAIYCELLESGGDHVWLDISGRDPSWIKDRFPNVYDYCLTKGYDITKQPLPVVPAAHFCCGGVVVDKSGQTSHQRLRAIGEVSCTGVHGARRLDGTSLLEGLVWGRACAEDVAKQLKKFAYYFPPVRSLHNGSEASDRLAIHQDWTAIRQTMWHYAGLITDESRLRRARQSLFELKDAVETRFQTCQITKETAGLRNGVQAAWLVTEATLEAELRSKSQTTAPSKVIAR